MFGFGLKKATPATAERSRLVGVDLSATRVRAVAAGIGSVRPLHLDDPHEDLPLFVALGGTSYAEYQVFAQRNAAGISKLRKALAANPATRNALAKNGVPVGIAISRPL